MACNHPECESYSRDDCRYLAIDKEVDGPVTTKVVSDPEDKILAMVQQQSISLADLYKKARAKGLVPARSAYN